MVALVVVLAIGSVAGVVVWAASKYTASQAAMWRAFAADTRAKRIVGVRDIEVESPPFNDRYHVRCDDERFAITLLDPPMIAWLLSPDSGLGNVNFELRDGWMLFSGKRLPLEQLPKMLAWSQSVRDQLPAVLTDLYPGRP